MPRIREKFSTPSWVGQTRGGVCALRVLPVCVRVLK